MATWALVLAELVLCVPGVDANAGKSFVQTFHYTHPTIESMSAHAFHLSTDQNDSCEITITAPLATYKVTVSGGRSVEYQVPRNLPRTRLPTYPPIRGIKLEGQCDFVVHGINFYKATTDGWLGIPVESLGSDYWVLNVMSTYSEPLQLSVAAVEDDTACSTTFPNGTIRGSNLKALDVDYMESDRDFTGTHIVCNKNVSIFSGQRCGVFPAGCRACGHMVEQLPPTRSFGRTYALAPINNDPCTTTPTCCSDPKHCADCMEFYRVVAAENDTLVLRVGSLTNESFTLQAGQSWLLVIPQYEYSNLLSTKPVLVGQYSKGWAYHDSSQAPFFTIVPSVERYKWHYTFMACLVKATYYINVVIRSDKASGLLLNGATFLTGVTGHSFPVTTLAAYEYTLSCKGAQSFLVEHSEKEPFGLLLYMQTSVAGSYGYPVGMNLGADVSSPVDLHALLTTGLPSSNGKNKGADKGDNEDSDTKSNNGKSDIATENESTLPAVRSDRLHLISTPGGEHGTGYQNHNMDDKSNDKKAGTDNKDDGKGHDGEVTSSEGVDIKGTKDKNGPKSAPPAIALIPTDGNAHDSQNRNNGGKRKDDENNTDKGDNGKNDSKGNNGKGNDVREAATPADTAKDDDKDKSNNGVRKHGQGKK